MSGVEDGVQADSRDEDGEDDLDRVWADDLDGVCADDLDGVRVDDLDGVWTDNLAGFRADYFDGVQFKGMSLKWVERMTTLKRKLSVPRTLERLTAPNRRL